MAELLLNRNTKNEYKIKIYKKTLRLKSQKLKKKQQEQLEKDKQAGKTRYDILIIREQKNNETTNSM